MIIKVRTPVYYASLYIEIANSFSAALRLFNLRTELVAMYIADLFNLL